MKISVLISIYFKENPIYFKAAIESIINQTYRPSEIVIVKDGDLTEELDEVINYYNLKYEGLFNIVCLEENKGLGIALNEGIKACKYDVIARMDGDDICVKDRFEKQINYLKENKQIDIVGSYISEFDKAIENIISTKKVPISNEEIYAYAKKRNPFNHMTVMFRKYAVINAGNYKDFKWNEDYYLWVRMLNKGIKAHNIPEILVHARTGDAMFERRGGKEYCKVEYRLQKEYLRLGFITKKEFLLNVLLRSFVRLIPNKVRRYIYTRFLRN